MTPERLRFIIDQSHARHAGPLVTNRALAKFLHIKPITLRRWLRGERPIPRAVELLFEIHHKWPEINSVTLQAIIDERDRADAALAAWLVRGME